MLTLKWTKFVHFVGAGLLTKSSISAIWALIYLGYFKTELPLSALAVAIRKPREWVAARELDEAIRLSEAVFEVNADFFIQRLAPVLARVASRVEMIGARFSNASSGTATATPKS